MPETKSNLPAEDKPNLNVLRNHEGIGTNTAGSSSGGSSSSTAGKGFFNEKGDTAGSTAGLGASGLPKAESRRTNSNSAGNLFNDEGEDNSSKTSSVRQFFSTKKGKATAGSGIIGTIAVVGGIAFFSIASGPFEFVHIAQLLEKFHFSSIENQSNDRLLRMMSDVHYETTGRAYHTNLSFLGNQMANKFESKLNDQGFTSAYDHIGYNKLGYVVDRDSENFKGLSDSEIKQKLQGQYGDNISFTTDSTGDLILEQPSGYISSQLLVKGVLEDAGYNSITSSIGARIMAQRDGVSLHPLQILDNKLFATLDAKIDEWQKTRVQNEQTGADPNTVIQEQEDAPAGTAPGDTSAQASANQVSGAASGTQTEAETAAQEIASGSGAAAASGALSNLTQSLGFKLTAGPIAAAGVLCLAHGIAQDSGNIKESETVLPLVRTGMRIMSEGSQVQSGQDIDLNQLSLDSKQLFNSSNGTSWTDSQSIQSELGQSYNSKTVYASKDKTLNSINSGTPFDVLTQGSFGSALGGVCSAVQSTLGQVAGDVIGFLGGPISFLGTTAISSIFGGTLVNDLAHYLAGDAVDVYASGGQFGNYVDYGSKLAANDQATSEGGRALTSSQVSVLNNANNTQAKNEFDQHSLAYRIFNPDDNMSLVSSIMDNQSNDIGVNLKDAAFSTLNIGQSLLTSFSSLFNGLAFANPAPFNYSGLPTDGISASEMDDPNVQNPYANGDAVATILDKNGQAGEPDYIGLAQQCFGDTLTQITITTPQGSTQQVWDVDFGTSTVNTFSAAYKQIAPMCNSTSDENWNRICMFIFDTENMKAIDCYDDPNQAQSDQSCQTFGLGTSAATSTPPPTTTGPTGGNTLPTGTSQQLASELLPYISSGQIVCGPDAGGTGPANCQDIQNTAEGVPVGGECSVTAITPHLLALILGLVQEDHWKLGISAICSNHSPDGNGPYGGHQYGSAADFSIQNGATDAAAAADEPFVNDAAALLSSTGGSFGQINCHSQAYPAITNNQFTTFPDSCTHQHIRAAP
jgi:hypothetical protein